MRDDKSLETTVKRTIYQNEQGADLLTFLLPTQYEGNDLSACAILLRYVLPDGTGRAESLDISPMPYDARHMRCDMRVGTGITSMPGDVELWLCAIGSDDGLVLKTGTETLHVECAREIMDSLSPDDLDELDRLFVKVKKLEDGKADDIAVTGGGDTLQLTANGKPIGRQVELDLDHEWAKSDDVIVSPALSALSALLLSLADGSSVRLLNGEVAEPFLVSSSVTISGAAAGMPQNHRQEVASE